MESAPLNPFAQRLADHIRSVNPEIMTQPERAIMALLFALFLEGAGRKITQRQIAAHERWLGCHPQHEADLPLNKEELTLRQVRQVVRDLRVKYRMPILADRSGYWIPRSIEEANEYLEGHEREVKAQIASWHETYVAMKEAFNLTNSFLENLYGGQGSQQSGVTHGTEVGTQTT